jgi:hypothetical protein
MVFILVFISRYNVYQSKVSLVFFMVLSSSSATLASQPIATSTNQAILPNAPLTHWWVVIFQQQAKLEQALTHKLAIKLPKFQEASVQTALSEALLRLRTQLQEAFQVCKALLLKPPTDDNERLPFVWLGSPQCAAVFALIDQQTQWAIRLETLLPQTKTKVAEMQQFAFIEAVVPRVLLQPQTVRILNNQSQATTPALPLAGLTVLEERIGWLKATTPLAWGTLIEGSLSAVAEQYILSLPSLPPLSTPKLSALLGLLLLGESYYCYWVTEALSNQPLMQTALFWETEALLFEALQAFNTGSTQTALWHQHLVAFKPLAFETQPLDYAAWFEALAVAIPTQLHATLEQGKRAALLQEKLKAGRFISAICQEDTHQLWETLTDTTKPMDIYACLQQITETPCEMKEMVHAVWLYQLQSQVPQWLAWLENPTQTGWQMLTHQLVKHETSVLKSIETALLHKTVLGQEV